ncbi:MAG: hypothetical protein EG824_11335 [Deltaproteobacteria bacterium]|nr:hypothetical protein [Deltaproteobacteria bacterium]
MKPWAKKPWIKGTVIAVIQVALVASLGAKLLSDRSTLPRAWAQAVPFDPDLPIRGRYVSLSLAVEARGAGEAKQGPGWQPPPAVTLRVEGGRLMAEPVRTDSGYDPAARHLRFIQRQDGGKLAVLAEPVAFFIPEHIPDPSRRPPGEELWVEVTLPRKGPPRPILLGVRRGSGPIVPMDVD